MDGLSVAASIIAVVQITGSVITYLADVRDAPKECEQCMIELSNLNTLLLQLKSHLNESKLPRTLYKLALEHLLAKVEPTNKMRKLVNILMWTFVKDEVASVLARTERLKTLISIALEMDHFKLSVSIKEDTSFARDTLPSLQAHIVAMRNAQNLRGDAQKLQQHHVIIEWLSPTDFPAQQHDIITRRQKGTGQWFLDTSEFNRWMQGTDKTLFCPGIPGAGKTMMAAIAIEHLYSMAGGNGIGIAFLFCSYKTQTDQSASNLFAALLKQLVQSRPDIAAPVEQMYDLHLTRGSKPSFSDIIQALRSVCSAYTTIHFVVDALDECSDRDGTRGQLIDILQELQVRTDVRLLFTSRFIPEITQKFQSNPILEVRASEQDVRNFVIGQMPRLPGCVQRDDELKCVVQNKIVEAVDGMFLLARLHVGSLLDKRNKQRVLSTLNTLSKGSAALDDAYSDALERIDGQLTEDRFLARQALSWISYAQRVLTTTELCHALAIEPGDKSLNNDNIYEVEDVVSVCAGLVTVDEESNIIRLVHYTIQEYFERVRLEWIPSAQEEIAVACLTYLSFNTFRSGSCGNDQTSNVSNEIFRARDEVSDEAFKQRLIENPFFDYTAHYWSEHVRPVQSITSQLVLAFLYDNGLVDSTAQGALTPKYKSSGYSRRFPNRTTGLHLTATYGLLELTERILMGTNGDGDIIADSKDSDGRTPLSYAAARGHDAVVRQLLEMGEVNVDSKPSGYPTPLWYATANGHEAVVRLLLEHGANVHPRHSPAGDTLLQQAAENGHEAVVRLLLGHKVDVNSVAGHFARGTALHRAALMGHDGVVRLLLENKADVNKLANADMDSADYDGVTALQRAAEKGHQGVVRLLLEYKADVHTESGWLGTALHRAAGAGHEAIVRLLLEHNAYVNASAGYLGGGTALHRAAGNGHEAVVRLLLEYKADVNAEARWETALQSAAKNGHEAVMRLLLEHKADVNTVSGWSGTALHRAAGAGHEAIVRLLVERDDVEADLKDKRGLTPLSHAAGRGLEAVVRLLVERDDVKADSKDNDGRTPLSHAAEERYEAIVRLLLKRSDVDADSKDKDGRTPLSWAARPGHRAMWSRRPDHRALWWARYRHEAAAIRLLLERSDVDADSKDRDSRTPLSLAAESGHEAVIQLLLDTGKVEADAMDNDRRTPLCWAAQNEQEAVIRLLQPSLAT